MKTISFTIHNQSALLDEALLARQMEDSAPLLALDNLKDPHYSDSLGWLEVDTWAGETWLTRCEALAATVQASADVLVVVGVGGSNQAARAVIDCMGEKGPVKILWAGNSLSAHSMQQVLSSLAGKRVYINVIAKNFETLEPGAAFRILRQWLRETYGEDYASHIICTGTERSHLHALCRQHGYAFLPFPHDIGGRFTALSPVGLFPLAVAGINIRALAAGAQQMQNTLMAASATRNIALQYACARNQLYHTGYRMELLCFFEPRLRRFGKWWAQLFGESEGKDGKGIYPLTANFSEDLHSIGQFIQEGSPILFETFLSATESGASLPIGGSDLDDRFDYLAGKDLDAINKAAYQATLSAHSARFPCFVLNLPDLTEHSFGQLFYFFFFSCYLSARILGVNPFNQPGVEAYKQQMFALLGK